MVRNDSKKQLHKAMLKIKRDFKNGPNFKHVLWLHPKRYEQADELPCELMRLFISANSHAFKRTT